MIQSPFDAAPAESEFRRLTEAPLSLPPGFAMLLGIPIGHAMARTAHLQGVDYSDAELQRIASDVLGLIPNLAAAGVAEIAEQAALRACREEFDRLRGSHLPTGGRA
jgi:hypothetical protein